MKSHLHKNGSHTHLRCVILDLTALVEGPMTLTFVSEMAGEIEAPDTDSTEVVWVIPQDVQQGQVTMPELGRY